MSIEFKQVSFNTLRQYISGRRMFYNCRLNLWRDYVLSVGVFYKGFLCGGVLVSRMGEDCKIETWYSREDRKKLELLDYAVNLIRLLGFNKVYLSIQKKWLALLLEQGWKTEGKMLFRMIGDKNE